MGKNRLAKVSSYNKFAEHNDHVMQFSRQRSGRVWLSSAVGRLLGKHAHSLELHDPGYDDINYVHAHYGTDILFFDRVKYVLIVRDPRDCYRSFIEMHIRHGTIDESAYKSEDRIKRFCNNWRLYFVCGIMDRDVLVIQYEYLCTKPIETLNRLLDHAPFLEPVKDPRAVMITNRDRRDDFQEPDVDYYKLHCLKWQRSEHFTKWHNDFIWNELGDIMVHYGYTYSGHMKSLLL